MGKRNKKLQYNDVWLKCLNCEAEAYVFKGHGRLTKVICTHCGVEGRVVLRDVQKDRGDE